MKKAILFTLAIVLFVVTSCIKEGPQGLAGADGAAGKDGTNGTAGAIGPQGPVGASPTVSCLTCHNSSSTIAAKELQYDSSLHSTGLAYLEETSSSCAPCHTNEGFNEICKTGATTASTVTEPTKIGCYTCHKIHTKYDSTDFDLKYSNRITASLANSAIGFPDFEKGNLCAKCHQARTVGTSSVTPSIMSDTLKNSTLVQIKIPSGATAPRLAPHEGPQGSFCAGVAGFDLGTSGITVSDHTDIVNSCVTCHMPAVYKGNKAGGHTCKMTYDNIGTLYDASCKTCHPTNLTAKLNNFKKEITDSLNTLKALLAQKNLLDTVKNTAKTGTVKAGLAKIVYNYFYIKNDKSTGVHNPEFARLLLKNSLDSIRVW